MAAACAAAMLVSCGGPAGGQQLDRGDPFDGLRAANGLYYHPFLRSEPTGVEDQSAALRTLAATGDAPLVSLDGAQQRQTHDDAVATSPLWGRYWLIAFRQAGATRVLGPADAAAVAKLRQKDGGYRDPVTSSSGTAARIGATWTALEVLHALGRPLPGAQRAATARWLAARASGTGDLAAAGVLARALSLLGRPVPATLTRRAAPSMAGFTRMTGDGQLGVIEQTYGYLQVRQAARLPVRLDPGAWDAVLEHNAMTLDFAHLEDVVDIVRAAGSGQTGLALAQRRLRADQLPDGTVTDPSSYEGSADASLWVEELRAIGGFPQRDRALDRALTAAAAQADTSPGSDDPLVLAALRRLTTGTLDGTDTAAARQACQPGQSLPAAVDAGSAGTWERVAGACTAAGQDVPVPRTAGWPLSTPAEVAAAASLVDGLHDAGLPEHTADWVTAAELEPWADNPQRLTSVYDYAQVVRAFRLLGGRPDAATRTAVRDGISPYRGCPGMPGLYRIGGPDPGCDLKTTWAVWRLARVLPGILQSPQAAATAGRTQRKKR